jgi:hypothetical protein
LSDGRIEKGSGSSSWGEGVLVDRGSFSFIFPSDNTFTPKVQRLVLHGEHVRGVAAATEPFAAATVHGPATSGALDGVAAGAVDVLDAYGADANDAFLSPRP